MYRRWNWNPTEMKYTHTHNHISWCGYARNSTNSERHMEIFPKLVFRIRLSYTATAVYIETFFFRCLIHSLLFVYLLNSNSVPFPLFIKICQQFHGEIVFAGRELRPNQTKPNECKANYYRHAIPLIECDT